MDEQRRQALQAELDDMVAERAELDTAIAVVAKRLGVPVPGPATEGEPASNGAAPRIAGDPVAAVNPGQFFGMTSTQASRALLTAVGRDKPLKTKEILEAINKGGLTIKNQQVLYRSLTRHPGFHNTGRGRWGLTEWYPNAKRKTTAGDESEEPAAEPAPSVEEPSTEAEHAEKV